MLQLEEQLRSCLIALVYLNKLSLWVEEEAEIVL